jgi:hypothetical protein
MKFILLVSTIITATGDGQAAAETSAVYGNAEACTKAVEIRTGYAMSPLKGGYALSVDIDTRYGKARTRFVCSPYGEEKL